MGTDGKPLSGASYQLQVRPIVEYQEWDGTRRETSWGATQATIDSNGHVSFSNSGLGVPKPGQYGIVAVRYEVVQVFSYWPSNPAVTWDGVAPDIRVTAP
jgi:hypothetical protein